ncbi:MAG TPA: alpha/beta hydrolase [Kofleriaceae bacterium]
MERAQTIAGTNVHVVGEGPPVVLIHGSGPGVTAWANWRLTMPALVERGYRVIAPDMLGFGYTERTGTYSKETWLAQLDRLFDASKLEQVDLVGNSFGGAIALAYAITRPRRVKSMVLMGAVGTRFPITAGLDAVWGYEPSIAAMKKLLDVFAYDRSIVTDELAELRYRASIEPGFQEAFAAMFPAPRQRWVDALASDDEQIRKVSHRALVVHGRDDQVIPLAASQRLAELLPNAELHVFNKCGHWTQIEHAARFTALVAEFFR